MHRVAGLCFAAFLTVCGLGGVCTNYQYLTAPHLVERSTDSVLSATGGILVGLIFLGIAARVARAFRGSAQ
jgi:hypothetical protein